MNKNLIAISGTHGCGKSYAAYKLTTDMRKNGYNVVVIDELARECPLSINQAASELTQYWILAAQIEREIALMSKYQYIITDRSVFDTLAYAVTLNLMNSNLFEFVANYVKNNYKYIFLLDPIGFNYHISDGIRDMDPKFRMDVHKNLVMLYEKFDISYIHMECEDVINGYVKRAFNLK